MVRAALWAVIACGVAPACGNKSDSPAAQPGAVAGKVLEVAGTVKVGAKQLAVGDRVNTDDVVETGADGNVVIELAHNQARWEIGANHKVRPTESMAWTLKRHGTAAQVDQDTSAAGRPAERSAADTSTSAKTAAPSAAAPPAAEAAMAPTVQPAPAPSAEAPSRSRAAVAPSPKPSADLEREDSAPRGLIGGASTGAGGGGAADLTADMFASLSKCLPAGTRTRVVIHVAKHVPAIKFDADAGPAVKKCMTAAAKKLSIAVASGDISLTLEH